MADVFKCIMVVFLRVVSCKFNSLFSSDPEPLLDLSGVSSHASAMSRGIPSQHGARYRRDDVTQAKRRDDVTQGKRRDDVTQGKRGQASDAANLLRPSRVAAVEQWARQSSGPRANLIPRRGSECSGYLLFCFISNGLVNCQLKVSASSFRSLFCFYTTTLLCTHCRQPNLGNDFWTFFVIRSIFGLLFTFKLWLINIKNV